MSVDRAASDRSPPPDSLRLLAIAVNRLGEVRAFGWFFALTIAGSVLTEFLRHKGLVAGFASMGLGLVNLYALFMLARQLMTGTLTSARSDVSNTLVLLAMAVALAVVMAIATVALFLVLPPDALAYIVAALAVLAPVLFYFIVRTAFYVPALALNDRISLRESLRQSAPYWKSLTVIFVVVALGAVLMHMIIDRLGLPWLLQSFVQGAIGAAAAILTLAPICYLYWRHVRPSV
jgi:hypothetical protein